MTLEEKVVHTLIDRKKTLAVAESCTGGLLTHRLTNVSGSSNCFKFGLITYGNDAKIKLLRIPSYKLKKYGAVSEEVSIAMAKNVRKLLKSDFGVGITGIAGPTGATKRKPIGLIFVTVCSKVETLCVKCQFKGTRTQIKLQTTTKVLELLDEFIT